MTANHSNKMIFRPDPNDIRKQELKHRIVHRSSESRSS